MLRYDRRSRILAVCLSALAGYVDAIGFLELGGSFVSFMSGNSTRTSVGLVSDREQAIVAVTIIAAFVVGVMLGSFIGRRVGRTRVSTLLVLIAAILAAAAALGSSGGLLSGVLMALAMGAENAVFERDGEVQIGLTYMTGTLVKFGQHLTTALLGGQRWGWVSYLLLWLGLVLGALCGAILYSRYTMAALWAAAAFSAVLSGLAVPLRFHGYRSIP